MTNTYVFANANNTIAIRSDGANVPWGNNAPADNGGLTYRTWVADGSPTPSAYVLPTDLFNRQVDSYRDTRLATGYADANTGKTFQCDSKSVGMWTALGSSAGFALTANAQTNTTFSIIAGDNTTIVLGANDTFNLMNQRIMPWISATMFYARSLKSSYVQGNTVPNITVGWP